eukprot:7019842-Prymnesium_polylepis.1
MQFSPAAISSLRLFSSDAPYRAAPMKTADASFSGRVMTNAAPTLAAVGDADIATLRVIRVTGRDAVASGACHAAASGAATRSRVHKDIPHRPGGPGCRDQPNCHSKIFFATSFAVSLVKSWVTWRNIVGSCNFLKNFLIGTARAPDKTSLRIPWAPPMCVRVRCACGVGVLHLACLLPDAWEGAACAAPSRAAAGHISPPGVACAALASAAAALLPTLTRRPRPPCRLAPSPSPQRGVVEVVYFALFEIQ